jgi:hypothetical protein
MTKEKFQTIKEEYINHLKNYMCEAGSLFPHITVFAEDLDVTNEKPCIVHIPIPPEYMKNDDTKDDFVNNIIPDLFVELKKKFTPVGIAWAAEAWARIGKKADNLNMDQIKKLPIKKEVVIITIETIDTSESFIYNIKRNGKQVTKDGDFIDNINLELAEESNGNLVGGRFSGLFELFKN